mmetsp:Transcript_20395/g.70045  ORF Transcript_20395/g.70045 Transcript_20395/m.70045 type:complete len:206 (-) Transcript_20395:212-829(-)
MEWPRSCSRNAMRSDSWSTASSALPRASVAGGASWSGLAAAREACWPSRLRASLQTRAAMSSTRSRQAWTAAPWPAHFGAMTSRMRFSSWFETSRSDSRMRASATISNLAVSRFDLCSSNALADSSSTATDARAAARSCCSRAASPLCCAAPAAAVARSRATASSAARCCCAAAESPSASLALSAALSDAMVCSSCAFSASSDST